MECHAVPAARLMSVAAAMAPTIEHDPAAVTAGPKKSRRQVAEIIAPTLPTSLLGAILQPAGRGARRRTAGEKMKRVGQSSMWMAAVTAVYCLIAAAASAQTLPQYGAAPHVGVQSCGGSTCHGAEQAFTGSTVMQNEYTVWKNQDRHSKAYAVLLNERSRRIARNLGLGSAAGAPVCLNCHADNVPEDKRGRQFNIADGVGCEACHGGGGAYLGVHISGAASHAANVQAGLYPSEEAGPRARLCLSCHFGDDGKFVTHRIMGAGHPRMPFELAAFTQSQPAHYVVDADYNQRKKAPGALQTWVVGQAVMLSELLEAMIHPRRGRDGAFPELVLFDCTACHHSLYDVRWEPRPNSGIQPGAVRFNDANAVMLRIVLQQSSPQLAAELEERTRALHQAIARSQGDAVAAARRLRETAQKAAGAASIGDTRRLLSAMVRAGLDGQFAYHNAAEQAAYALDHLTAAVRGNVSEGQFRAMRAAVQEARRIVAKDYSFKPAAFRGALADLDEALGRR
jgi:Cytochrome c554 and c-prime